MNHIYSCYITGRVGNTVLASSSITSVSGTTTNTYVGAQFDIQNCLFKPAASDTHLLGNLEKSIVNNNTFIYTYSVGNRYYCISGVSNSQITNNILYCYNSNSTYKGAYCLAVDATNVVERNIMNQSLPTNYPDNNCNSNLLQLFVSKGNYSDYYKLKTDVTDNYALTYGTDGKEVGCHGGMFGCPSGGRAQYIPYFTKVVVGQRTENGKLPVSLEVKIQDE
jgi:hypothetical protein